MVRLLLVCVVGCVVGCAAPAPWDGTPAAARMPELEAAFFLADEAGAADPECLEADIQFRFVANAEWEALQLGETTRGVTEDDGAGAWWRVSVRLETPDGAPRSEAEISEILTHEFLHALLACGGADWSENVLHEGAWWDGLLAGRDTDPARRGGK